MEAERSQSLGRSARRGDTFSSPRGAALADPVLHLVRGGNKPNCDGSQGYNVGRSRSEARGIELEAERLVITPQPRLEMPRHGERKLGCAAICSEPEGRNRPDDFAGGLIAHDYGRPAQNLGRTRARERAWCADPPWSWQATAPRTMHPRIVRKTALCRSIGERSQAHHEQGPDRRCWQPEHRRASPIVIPEPNRNSLWAFPGSASRHTDLTETCIRAPPKRRFRRPSQAAIPCILSWLNDRLCWQLQGVEGCR